MRNRLSKAGLVGVTAALLGASSLMALAGDDNDRGRERSRFFVSAELIGFQEVPAVSTTAKGRFWALVDTKANTITFKLTYDPLEGDVQQAHVHFGQKSVNGGVSFFLCSNLAAPPGPLPAPCPVGPAEVTGVITPGSHHWSGGPGHRGGRLRRDRGGHEGRHGLRQRPLVQVAGRRDSRPVALIKGAKKARARAPNGVRAPADADFRRKMSRRTVVSCTLRRGR